MGCRGGGRGYPHRQPLPIAPATFPVGRTLLHVGRSGAAYSAKPGSSGVAVGLTAQAVAEVKNMAAMVASISLGFIVPLCSTFVVTAVWKVPG